MTISPRFIGHAGKLFAEGAALLVIASALATSSGQILESSFFNPSSSGISSVITSATATGGKGEGRKAKHVTQAEGLVTKYDQSKASPGYLLYPTAGTAEILLTKLDGTVVNKWNLDAERARLLPNGNLLIIHGGKWGKDIAPWKDLRDRIREYDWNGNLVWEYKASEIVHHDVRRLPNGNTLSLRRELVPANLKAKLNDDDLKLQELRSDTIIEVNPGGQLVWEWKTQDHLDLNSCGRRPCRFQDGADGEKENANEPHDWTHVNTAFALPENKWFDAGDTRFRPGNVLFLPRNWWTVLLVDKPSGEVVWNYGGDYRGGLSGGHEVTMIEKGLPGEGNILVLDNGSAHHHGESIVLEVNPTTSKVVWKYEAGKKFFTGTRGLIQRLPNGNTFIAEDNTGRSFEVTPAGEIVWEYVTNTLSSRAQRYPLEFLQQLH
jgi:hypothetical protein